MKNKSLQEQPIIQTPWLFPEEHEWVVRNLYNFGLIKISSKRDLPLKSGGKTDIYISLRDARNNPAAIKFIADLFSLPLRRLNPDRFVEIPDSVSCFAGPLAINTGIPYFTIREQAKDGRVSDAKRIGQPVWGENVCLIDDVITDGASKVIPYQECQRLGLNVQSLIVLVDRQQGWRKHLAKAEVNANMNVWAGMTLHDVRFQLIKMGLIKRCEEENERINPIIVALDGKSSWEEILPIVDPLRTTGCILKVNDFLFGDGIDHLLPKLSIYGRVMADLKSHDIPNTVANTCKRLKAYPPWAVTVHASGGEEMVKAATETLYDTDTKVLAITVLTSINEKTGEEIYSRRPLEQVIKLAEIAARAGAHGFVCSPEEVATLRELYPNKTLVTPGIRSAGVDADDQARLATPKAAIERGASNIVLGRQILGAPNPVAEMKRVLIEELGLTLV